MCSLDKQLIEASKYGDFLQVKYLIENGADIHAQNNYVLCWSARSGHLNIVNYLVENGSDIHARNDYALRYSANNGYLVVVKYLVENGADIHANNDDALRLSATYDHIEIVKYLVENGADIHAQDNYALRWSARNDNFDIVKYLVENGANQKVLFEEWDREKIAKLFLEIDNYEPIKQHTNELCSESFELPTVGDLYIIWEDNSITKFENVHLASVEPELVKGIYIQC